MAQTAPRTVVFLRSGAGVEVSTHGPNGPRPCDRLLPPVGMPPPAFLQFPLLRPFKAHSAAIIVHCPAPTPPMAHGTQAGRDAILVGVRNLLLEVLPDDAKGKLRQFAMAHLTTAEYSYLLTTLPPTAPHAMVAPAVGVVTNVVVGYLNFIEQISFIMDEDWSAYVGIVPHRGRSKRVKVDIGGLALFGLGASLRVVSMGVTGRGAASTRRGDDALHENSSTLVRCVWYNAAVNKLLGNCTTTADHDVQLSSRRAAAAHQGEAPILPLRKRRREEHVDETLALALQMMYDAATPRTVDFDSWSVPGVNHIRATLLERYWHDNMNKILNAWRREWRLAQPGIKARRPYKMRDFALHPEGPQYGVFLELNRRDPVDRRCVIVAGHTNCGKSTLMTQLSMRDHTESFPDMEWAGFMRIEPAMIASQDGLKRVYQATQAGALRSLGDEFGAAGRFVRTTARQCGQFVGRAFPWPMHNVRGRLHHLVPPLGHFLQR